MAFQAGFASGRCAQDRRLWIKSPRPPGESKTGRAASARGRRLIERGAQALSDAELLAVILGSGTSGRSSLELARELLREFGSSAPPAHRRSAAPARAARSRAGALRHAHGRARARAAPLLRGAAHGAGHERPAATRQFLTAQLRDRPYEVFCCLHLDNRHRLIHFEEVFRGTIDGASVHPREVVRQALQYNAAALIFAHNHPSGVAEASQADELITRRLRDALALVDIRVLDHLIVGDNTCLSFAERGML